MKPATIPTLPAAALEELISQLAHDIAGPARRLRQLAELATQEEEDAARHEALQAITHNAQALTEMVDLLVRYHRLRPDPRPQRTELDPVIATAWREAQKKEGRQANLVAPPLPSVAVAPAHCQTVFDALLHNALRFSPGTPTIHIEATTEAGFVQIAVTDPGIGFSPERVEDVFRPLHKQHSRKRFPGPGMGLALVHRIATMYGGHATATTERGKGSRFIVAMPL